MVFVFAGHSLTDAWLLRLSGTSGFQAAFLYLVSIATDAGIK